MDIDGPEHLAVLRDLERVPLQFGHFFKVLVSSELAHDINRQRRFDESAAVPQSCQLVIVELLDFGRHLGEMQSFGGFSGRLAKSPARREEEQCQGEGDWQEFHGDQGWVEINTGEHGKP